MIVRLRLSRSILVVTHSLLPYNMNMSQVASHIYNPINITFEERMRSYKSALSAYRSVEISARNMGDTDWADRIGTEQELDDARTILSNSLALAAKSVSANEVRKAEKIGWLDADDMKLITRFERLQEIQEQRKSKKEQQQSHKNQNKQ